MRGVILAAGRGGRLRAATGANPKCLARIGAETLIERQMRSLRANGVSPLTIVGGYHIDDVRRVCGPRVEMRHNADFASTNSLYSLWLVRDLLWGGFVVLNCDVLFHPQLLADLLTAEYEDALLMGARGDEQYSDEEMKVRVRAGRVVAIAKNIESADADGENVGIAKFSAAGAAVLIDAMDRLIQDGKVNAWLPAAFEAFAARRPLYAVESRGLPWIEIDSPEDYWRACATVLPRIDAGDVRRHPPEVAAAAGRPLRHV